MEAHDPPSFVAYYHRQSSISALPRIARTAVDGDDDEKDGRTGLWPKHGSRGKKESGRKTSFQRKRTKMRGTANKYFMSEKKKNRSTR